MQITSKAISRTRQLVVNVKSIKGDALGHNYHRVDKCLLVLMWGGPCLFLWPLTFFPRVHSRSWFLLYIPRLSFHMFTCEYDWGDLKTFVWASPSEEIGTYLLGIMWKHSIFAIIMMGNSEALYPQISRQLLTIAWDEQGPECIWLWFQVPTTSLLSQNGLVRQDSKNIPIMLSLSII